MAALENYYGNTQTFGTNFGARSGFESGSIVADRAVIVEKIIAQNALGNAVFFQLYNTATVTNGLVPFVSYYVAASGNLSLDLSLYMPNALSYGFSTNYAQMTGTSAGNVLIQYR